MCWEYFVYSGIQSEWPRWCLALGDQLKENLAVSVCFSESCNTRINTPGDTLLSQIGLSAGQKVLNSSQYAEALDLILPVIWIFVLGRHALMETGKNLVYKSCRKWCQCGKNSPMRPQTTFSTLTMDNGMKTLATLHSSFGRATKYAIGMITIICSSVTVRGKSKW